VTGERFFKASRTGRCSFVSKMPVELPLPVSHQGL